MQRQSVSRPASIDLSLGKAIHAELAAILFDHAQNAFRSAANMAPAEWNHTHHLVKAIRNASDVFRSIGKNVERSERHMNFL